ncbi:MAG: glucosaminidase domain-containing protein [Aureispira sp.]|nr:glucosaminidase domain-containing protein [Aureispira sp.]
MILNKQLITVKKKFQTALIQFRPNIHKSIIRASLLALLIIMVSQKELSFHFSIGGEQNQHINQSPKEVKKMVPLPAAEKKPKKIQRTSIFPQAASWKKVQEKQNSINNDLNLANAATATSDALTPEQQKKAAKLSNLVVALNPSYLKRHNIAPNIVAEKQRICLSYIATHLKTANEEAKMFDIPVSITLAQGLLESNAGHSRLAKNDNNHFGIKCRKKCIGCRCANYTDDSKYDMFRIFDSAWYSFREHSKLLSGKRYRHLKKLPRSDYENWAHGLQAAGYATDKKYAKKLITIIEAYQLYRFDQ